MLEIIPNLRTLRNPRAPPQKVVNTECTESFIGASCAFRGWCHTYAARLVFAGVATRPYANFGDLSACQASNHFRSSE